MGEPITGPDWGGRGPGRRPGRRGCWVAGCALLLAATAPLLLGALLWARCGLQGCPDVARLRAYQPGGAPLVLDRHGREIGELSLSEHRVVALADLPPHLPEAFLAVEDKRFREHRGVDWIRVLGALVANLRAGEVREGSSTLTMQLARTLFTDHVSVEDRTLRRKLVEARLARRVETAYDKEEILELYLNHVYLGAGKRGVEAAAQHYFGSGATELTLAQAALLAALPKAPSHYDPRSRPDEARERRDLVLRLMSEQGRISSAEAAEASAASLGVSRRPREPAAEVPFAGYFLERVRSDLEERFGDSLYRERVRVITSLDREAQRIAEAELAAQLRRIESGSLGRFEGPRYSAGGGDAEGTDYLQGAVAVLDAATGDVLAWVGGRDFGGSRFDRAAHAHRQVGSAIKPFVYAVAIASGLPPTHVLSDLPVVVPAADGTRWEPDNFGDSYLPLVTLRQALVESRNSATIRLAAELDLDEVVGLAHRAGLRSVTEHPAMVLGADEATPAELTSAFTPFATLGRGARPRSILRVESATGERLWQAPAPETREVLDPAVAYILTDLLQESLQRGTGSAAYRVGLGVPAAGKTGTTDEGQDAWFVGYTPEVVATVWIGFDRPRTIVREASGGRLAAPVWGRLVRELYRGRRHPGGWPPPPGVVVAQVDASTLAVVAPGCPVAPEVTFTEVFLAEAMPPVVCRGVREGGLWSRLRGWWAPPDVPAPAAGARSDSAAAEPGLAAQQLRDRAESQRLRADRRLREQLREEAKRERELRRERRKGKGEKQGRGRDGP